MAQWLEYLSVQHQTFATKLAEPQSLMIQPRIRTTATSVRRSPPGPGQARTRSCSPPKPEIKSATLTLERLADRDADIEAAA